MRVQFLSFFVGNKYDCAAIITKFALQTGMSQTKVFSVAKSGRSPIPALTMYSGLNKEKQVERGCAEMLYPLKDSIKTVMVPSSRPDILFI